jgi:hypothetical protein
MGVSLYDYAGMTEPLWSALRSMPVQPGVVTPSPAPLPSTGAVGNMPSGDRRHPKEAYFATGPAHGPLVLRFQAFDAGVREVSIHVNRHVSDWWVWHTPKGAWSSTRHRVIPAGWLRSNSNNLISFVAVGNAPHWSVWGVRAVSVEPA